MFPQVFGKYILEGELARGGMARVLLATLRGAGGFEKKLVVKQIRDELADDREFVRRLVEEAKTTVALRHPNIVPVYELGVEQGTYFLAMELVDGLSLADLLDAPAGSEGPRRAGGGRERTRLTPDEGAYVGVEVCRALDYAHRRMALLHRDITPRNVMIDEEGQVRVIDFGIAAPFSTVAPPFASAGEGPRLREVFGSPGHMPPEQMEGATLGPPADVFAVGVLLMEAWTGAPPFRRSTLDACIAAMRAPHPSPGAFDARLVPLDDVLARVMDLDPGRRPQDIDELGRALRRFLAGDDTGDIARALGERVHDARAARSRRLLLDDEKAAPARAPSHEERGSRTIALRDEVRVWTRSERARRDEPREVRALHDEGPVTRPLAPSHPALADPLERASPEAPRTSGAAPAVPSTSPSLPAASAHRNAYAGLATLAVLGVGASFALLHRAPPPATQVPSPPSSHEPPASEASSSTSTLDAVPDSGASPGSKGAAPAAAVTSFATGAAAYLSAFGDRDVQLYVDGALRGGFPLSRLALPPGPHDLRLVFGPTGEEQRRSLRFDPGEQVVVRADFTGAAPSVRVERHGAGGSAGRNAGAPE